MNDKERLALALKHKEILCCLLRDPHRSFAAYTWQAREWSDKVDRAFERIKQESEGL